MNHMKVAAIIAADLIGSVFEALIQEKLHKASSAHLYTSQKKVIQIKKRQTT